jgi:hypothetical protein
MKIFIQLWKKIKIKKNKGMKNWMKNLTSKLWMKTFHSDEKQKKEKRKK